MRFYYPAIRFAGRCDPIDNDQTFGDIRRRAVRRLEYLDMATGLEDLKVPPRNRLHELQRERKGQYSISVNDQWRICFRFEDGDAYDAELTDYH